MHIKFKVFDVLKFLSHTLRWPTAYRLAERFVKDSDSDDEKEREGAHSDSDSNEGRRDPKESFLKGKLQNIFVLFDLTG